MHFKNTGLRIISTALCLGLTIGPSLQVLADNDVVAEEAVEVAPAPEAVESLPALPAEAANAVAAETAADTAQTEQTKQQKQQSSTAKQEGTKQEAAKAEAESTRQAENTVDDEQTEQAVDPATVKTYLVNQSCTDAQLNEWFSDAGFVGNSIGVGLASYFKRQGAGYLGGPKLMVRGSYSFLNDGKSNPKYRIEYNGYNGPAREVVAKSGVKKVFINMGTNDLWEAPAKAYQRYVDYIQGIQASSPGIIVFVEATTGVVAGHENRGLSNKNVDELNNMMKSYCSGKKDVYFIDINSPMKENGSLKASLSSDKDVHLTNTAYKIWMDTVVRYIDNKLSKGTL